MEGPGSSPQCCKRRAKIKENIRGRGWAARPRQLPKEGIEVGLWFQRASLYDGDAKAQLRAHTLFHNQEAQSKNLTSLLKPLSLSLVTHLKQDHTYSSFLNSSKYWNIWGPGIETGEPVGAICFKSPQSFMVSLVGKDLVESQFAVLFYTSYALC